MIITEQMLRDNGYQEMYNRVPDNTWEWKGSWHKEFWEVDGLIFDLIIDYYRDKCEALAYFKLNSIIFKVSKIARHFTIKEVEDFFNNIYKVIS